MLLAVKYTAFAVIATVLNLLAQESVVQAYDGAFSLYLAMGAGTLAGLVSKYWLDKRFIFAFVTASGRDDLQRFLVYGSTGILTTALFWGCELAFDYLYADKLARYLGACLGLAIGYGVKYRLDKHLVFAR